MQPRDTLNNSTGKWLPCADNEGEEHETVIKIAPIRQETQRKETAEQYDKTWYKNEENNIITVNRNGKWWTKNKINNNQQSVVQ